jgi:hypothetical protein
MKTKIFGGRDNTRLSQFVIGGCFLTLIPSGALAATITNAGISITDLTITGDQSFVVLSDNGTVSAKTGVDSFGHISSQTVGISGATSADATISTATAHADSTGTTFNLSGLSITVPQTFNASSSVNLTGGSSSISFGLSNPIFEAQAPNASPTNPINLTFSMTFSGLLGGSADAGGTYTSEATAQFGYQSNDTPFPFIPVVSFDQVLSGGPSDSKNSVIGPQTLTGTWTLGSSGDFFLFASAEAQSSAREGVGATPLPAALPLFASGLGAMGLLGWRRKRKNAAAITA